MSALRRARLLPLSRGAARGGIFFQFFSIMGRLPRGRRPFFLCQKTTKLFSLKNRQSYFAAFAKRQSSQLCRAGSKLPPGATTASPSFPMSRLPVIAGRRLFLLVPIETAPSVCLWPSTRPGRRLFFFFWSPSRTTETRKNKATMTILPVLYKPSTRVGRRLFFCPFFFVSTPKRLSYYR